MKRIIEYLSTQLDAKYKKTAKHGHTFVFEYQKIKCRLTIKDLNYIKQPKLLISNQKRYRKIKDSHLQEDGYACLSLMQKELSPEELVFKIADWCESLLKRVQGGPHTHGYRHGFAGVVEEYFSQHDLPLLVKFAKQVNEDKLFSIARENASFEKKSNQELQKLWKCIKENWNETMD